ncbi:hypothetical protein FRC01_005071, partial [Tulasnella sp. 417]
MSSQPHPNEEAAKALAELERFKPTLAAKRIERDGTLRGKHLLDLLHHMPPDRKREVAPHLPNQILADCLSTAPSAQAAAQLCSLLPPERQIAIINAFPNETFALDVDEELSKLSRPQDMPPPSTSAPLVFDTVSQVGRKQPPINPTTLPAQPLVAVNNKAVDQFPSALVPSFIPPPFHPTGFDGSVKLGLSEKGSSSTTSRPLTTPHIDSSTIGAPPSPSKAALATIPSLLDGEALVTPTHPTRPLKRDRSPWTPPSHVGLPIVHSSAIGTTVASLKDSSLPALSTSTKLKTGRDASDRPLVCTTPPKPNAFNRSGSSKPSTKQQGSGEGGADHQLTGDSSAAPTGAIHEGGKDRIDSWVQSVARSMRNARIASKSRGAGLFVAPRHMPNLWNNLVGKKRATTAFESWVEDKENKQKVKEAVEKELDELGLKTRLTESEKATYQEQAKSGGKPRTKAQRRALVDNTVEVALDMFHRVADETGMRIVLLAAGQGDQGVSIVVREFSRSFKEGQFLATELGRRLKHGWMDFTMDAFSADASEIVEIDDEEYDDELAEAEDQEDEEGFNAQPGPSSSKQAKSRTIFHASPFLPLADCNTRHKKDQFVGKWVLDLIYKFSGTRSTWKKISRSPDKYVDPQRMPADPKDPRKEIRLKFEEPSRMTDDASGVFWQHVLDSANGMLPDAEAFTIKAFDAQRLIPRVAVPKTTAHQAALNSSRIKSVKTKGKAPIAGSKAKQGVGAMKKRRRVETDEEEEEDFQELLDEVNPEDWSDDSDVAMEDQECAPRRSSRCTSSSTRLPIAAEDEVEKDEDFGFGDATGGYGSDDSTKDKTWRPAGETDHPTSMAITAPTPPSSPPPPAHFQAAPILAPVPRSPLDQPPLSPTDEAFYTEAERDDAFLEIEGSDLEASSAMDDASSTSLVWGVDHLFHPEIMKATREQDDGFKAHWEAFKKHGANAQFVGRKQRSIPLSVTASVGMRFQFPAAISSAMCLSQIWHVFQAHDLTKSHPLVTPSVLGPLEGLSPEHHTRLVASDVVDINCAIPSTKFIESTVGTSQAATNALLLHFKNSLIDYNDQVISSPEIVQYGDLCLPQALRLAAVVSSSGYLRDKGGFGHHGARVQDICDRFAQTLAAIALIRYFQEVMGRSIDYWWREAQNNQDLGNLWLRIEAFWKRGIRSLANALVAGRTDNAGSGALHKLIDTVLAQPAWWNATNKTIPAIQTFKGKQSIPGSDAYQTLQVINWSKATFMDHALAMLLGFAGGVQLSKGCVPVGDQPDGNQLRSWAELICKITPMDDAEIGPLGPTKIDWTPFLNEVEVWIAHWAKEELGGPGTRL